MSQKDIQDSILNAIEMLVEEELKRTEYTTSHIGRIVSVDNLDCKVQIHGDIVSARLFNHLRGQLTTGDIVIVNDLYNDQSRRFVQSKVTSND